MSGESGGDTGGNTGAGEGAEPGQREVGAALSTLQTMLDRLTSRGQHAAAFEIARAQFSASVRASWPANLSAVAAAIDKALADGAAALTPDEAEELRRAADVLRRVQHG